MKNTILISIMAICMLGLVSIVWAGEGCGDSAGMSAATDQAAGASTTSASVNVGNKICPVSGNKVDGVTTFAYEGKEYNVCCSACLVSFKKDPQTYIKKTEEELKTQAAAAATTAVTEPAAAVTK
jgi:YHS domain-containing protein